jgi:ribosomal protein S7
MFYLNVDIRAWKKSGRSLTVPTPIKSKTRRLFLFIHWIKFFVLTSRKEQTFSKRISGEFLDLVFRKGSAIKKLNATYKLVHSNRALIRKSRILLV